MNDGLVVKKRVLFLLDDVWSLGRNKGVSSTHMVIERASEEFDCLLMTTDRDHCAEGLSLAGIFLLKKIRLRFANRYADYVIAQINYFLLTVSYVARAILSGFRPDVIYANSAMPVMAAYFLGKYFRCKVVHRIYGTFLLDVLSSRIGKIKKWQEVLSFSVPADKYIITNDGTAGDRVAAYYGIPESKLCFWRNGVEKVNVTDGERLAIRRKIIRECGLPEDAFLILSVSRLVGWKRVDRSIKAMNAIGRNGIYLLVVGDGEMAEAYKAMSTNKNTIFLGSKTRQEVQECMLAADVFVSMYDISNLGNPLFEAFSVGLPIITYNSGATKDVVDGNNAILIEARGEGEVVAALKMQIINLFENRQARERLSTNAQNYSDKFLMSWPQRIGAEIEVIKEMAV